MLLLTGSVTALACGGFFCDSPPVDRYSPVVELPVAQAGEKIVFGVDDGFVTAHVLISYEGDTDAFAWVLPVPGVPEVFLSSDELFEALDGATAPAPILSRLEHGCSYGDADSDSDSDVDADADSDADTDGGYYGAPAVTVVSQEVVGPYESVVLQSDDAGLLVQWLQDNGYDVPDSFTGAVAPYVAPGMSFLALKLAKDTDAGDIEPIALRWPGDHASIPLSLTAIAATPDMPVTVWLVGPGRGVPLSWLHVDLHPLAWDWLGIGLDLPVRLGRAADEAGGNAFMTAYAGPSDVRVGVPSTDGLGAIDSALAWFQALPQQILDDAALVPILYEHVPPPEGVGLEFYNRTYDWLAEWAALDATFNPYLATLAIEERIVEPRREADALLAAGRWLTRLDTVVSPGEMAVDPLFGFNPDLGEVARFRIAQMHTWCESGEEAAEADRTLVLEEVGATLPLPPESAFATQNWIDAQILHHALVITQFSESGAGTVIADHTDELDWDLPEPWPWDEGAPEDLTGSEGCGCDGTHAGLLPLALLGLLLRPRRR